MLEKTEVKNFFKFSEEIEFFILNAICGAHKKECEIKFLPTNKEITYGRVG